MRPMPLERYAIERDLRRENPRANAAWVRLEAERTLRAREKAEEARKQPQPPTIQRDLFR